MPSPVHLQILIPLIQNDHLTGALRKEPSTGTVVGSDLENPVIFFHFQPLEKIFP